MKNFNTITQLYQKAETSPLTSLTQLKSNFLKLDQLNQILANILPANLVGTCHVGAIDEEKNIVVLFISNQQSFHLLRNLNNHILQAFTEKHFAFDKILMKVGQYNNQTSSNKNTTD